MSRRARAKRGRRKGTPSAAFMVFGLRGLIVAREGFRVHIEAPWLEALAAWLDGARGTHASPSTRLFRRG